MGDRARAGAGGGSVGADGGRAHLAVSRATCFLRRHQGRISIAGLATAIGISNFLTLSTIRDQADCQSAYNQTFTEARAAQITAADRERQITRDIIGGFADLYLHPPKGTVAIEEARQAKLLFRNYQRASAAADAARAANPLPPTPQC